MERRLRETLARCHEQLQASIDEFGLTTERIERVVATALDLARQPPLQPTDVSGEFRLPPLGGSWQRTSEGMTDRLSGDELPFTFDRDSQRTVTMWCSATSGTASSPSRCACSGPRCGQRAATEVSPASTARPVPPLPEVLESGDVGVLCHARLVITGADGHRLHEELVVAGGRLRRGRWSRIDTLRDLDALLRTAGDRPIDTGDLTEVDRWWESVVEPGLNSALERPRRDGAGLQAPRACRTRLGPRPTPCGRCSPTFNVRSPPTSTRSALERAEQLSLFTAPEREQSQRDIDALRRRLDEIPEEIEREVEAVQRRFTDPDCHIFPAAVTLLIPEETN